MEATNGSQPTLKQFLESRFRPAGLGSKVDPNVTADFKTAQLDALKALQSKTNSSNFFDGSISSSDEDSEISAGFGDLTGGVDNPTDEDDSSFFLKTGSAGLFSKALLEKSKDTQTIFDRIEGMKKKGDHFLPEELETSLDEAMESLGKGKPLAPEDAKKRSLLFFNYTSVQISVSARSTDPAEKEKAEELANASMTSISFFATEYDSDESVKQLTDIWKDVHEKQSGKMLNFVERLLASIYQGTPFQSDPNDAETAINFKPAKGDRADRVKSIIDGAAAEVDDVESVANVTGEVPPISIPGFDIDLTSAAEEEEEVETPIVTS